jgi:hypothetical protein
MSLGGVQRTGALLARGKPADVWVDEPVAAS